MDENGACNGAHRPPRSQRHRRDGNGGRPEEEVRLSKKLSALLRHRIHENGLSAVLRPDGYLPLAAVLATPSLKHMGATEEAVVRVVASCEKQRFSLLREHGTAFIRANQGHSLRQGLDDDALLERLDDAALAQLKRAVHGTYRSAWPAIVASGGLSRMARTHIHLAANLPGASGVISGMRASAQIEVWVDLLSAAHAGMTFFRSANGVILTAGLGELGLLPIEHVECAIERSTGRIWRSGGAEAWREE